MTGDMSSYWIRSASNELRYVRLMFISNREPVLMTASDIVLIPLSHTPDSVCSHISFSGEGGDDHLTQGGGWIGLQSTRTTRWKTNSPCGYLVFNT